MQNYKFLLLRVYRETEKSDKANQICTQQYLIPLSMKIKVAFFVFRFLDAAQHLIRVFLV